MPESAPRPTPPPTPGRIVVLASGGGSNCQALIDACATAELDAQIVAVITNRADAGVLARADAVRIVSEVVAHVGKATSQRQDADRRLIESVQAHQPDLVVLAGWMRILGAEVGKAFPMINLHPAKPGEFPGVRSIERAFAAFTQGKISESGVMVHWVPDEGVDVGPVIATVSVPILASDSLEDFAARMHTAEHQLIVQAAELALVEKFIL